MTSYGKALTSAGKDGRVFLWNVDLHSWRTKACEVAGRSLHPAERENHLPSIASRPWRRRLSRRPAPRMPCAGRTRGAGGRAGAGAGSLPRGGGGGRGTADAWINNDVCWYGSIAGFAGAVLPACERAVQMAVDEDQWQVRDSRGVALAVTGRAGASAGGLPAVREVG